jgi:hypothetical protein
VNLSWNRYCDFNPDRPKHFALGAILGTTSSIFLGFSWQVTRTDNEVLIRHIT